MVKNWFEVSRDGLRELWLGKPKSYVLRELVQNAWDEDIAECNVMLEYADGIAVISVEDDSPEGFRDLRDSFTLFGKTYKRSDPTKRGRFNVGEKQAFSICNEARVETTKGSVIFKREGRRASKSRREKGSKVTVKLKMSKKEFDEICCTVRTYLVPKGIKFTVNGEVIKYREPYKVIEASLLTEKEEDEILKKTIRKTQVHIHKIVGGGEATLSEMGIPVSTIDCDFSLDVQQKIPLSIDRETVLPSFLRDLYAEVLNSVHDEIPEESASQVWIREAVSDERISGEAVRTVIKKRYGDKVCVANPFDRLSIDEATSHGYKVIHGSEMSKEEWENVKAHDTIQSSSELFGASFVDAKVVEESELTDNHRKVRTYTQKIAKRLLGVDLKVVFIRSPKATCSAQYGNGTLTFNLSKLSASFFDPPVSERTTDLILHELGHHEGLHTEKSYHELLTKMAGELIMIALKEQEFFKI